MTVFVFVFVVFFFVEEKIYEPYEKEEEKKTIHHV